MLLYRGGCQPHSQGSIPRDTALFVLDFRLFVVCCPAFRARALVVFLLPDPIPFLVFHRDSFVVIARLTCIYDLIALSFFGALLSVLCPLSPLSLAIPAHFL